MKVKEIMSREIAYITKDNSIQEAARMMRDLNVGDLPVIAGNEVIGFITDRDITVRVVAHGLDPQVVRVANAMTDGIVACNEEDDIETAARQMSDLKVRRIAVTDEREKLSGMLSLSDIAVHAGNHLAGEVLEALGASRNAP